MHSLSLLPPLFWFSILYSCRAQDTAFKWQFTDSNPTLLTCETRSINISGDGVPPYYMIAYDVGGTPTSAYIGSGADDLKWTIDHPADHLLMLTVVDSNRTCGGVPRNFFEVQAGPSTSCISQNMSQSSDFIVVANVTSTIGTCDPWGVHVSGGSPPYSVTYSQLGTPVLTNFTFNPGDDVYTFYDAGGDPSTIMIAAVYDREGRWASGTPNVSTHASPKSACEHFQDSSGRASAMPEWQAFLNSTSSVSQTSATSTSAFSSNSLASSTPSPSTPSQNMSNTSLNVGTKAGIGIGAAFAGLVGLTVCILSIRRSRTYGGHDTEAAPTSLSAPNTNMAVTDFSASANPVTPFPQTSRPTLFLGMPSVEHPPKQRATVDPLEPSSSSNASPATTSVRSHPSLSRTLGSAEAAELIQQIRAMREQMNLMQPPPGYTN